MGNTHPEEDHYLLLYHRPWASGHVYLWRLLPQGEDCYVCIQEYNGLTWAESNAETIHSFSTNDDVFMIVATIKCRMGVDIRNIEVSINLGLPESAEAIQGEYSVLPERNLVT